MLSNNKDLLKAITEIRENIYDECQKNAYFAPVKYQRCCVRILNAEMALYDDTISIMSNHSNIGIKTELPLDKLVELQQKTLNILLEPENIIDKEKKLQELFIQQKISPKKYFRLNAKISELLPTVARAN